MNAAEVANLLRCKMRLSHGSRSRAACQALAAGGCLAIAMFGTLSLMSEVKAGTPGPGTALLVGAGFLTLFAFIRKAATVPMIRWERFDREYEDHWDISE